MLRLSRSSPETNVPHPRLVYTRPESSSIFFAQRTVSRDTSYRFASMCSLGNAPKGANLPSAISLASSL